MSEAMETESAGIPATTLARKKVLVPLDGAVDDLCRVVEALLSADSITRSKLAEKLQDERKRPSASHISRWLNPRRKEMPMWVLQKIASLLERSVLLALVDVEPGEQKMAASPVSRLLREFFVGMGYLNLREGPVAVARHIASVWNATSWSLYREDPRKNILEWFAGQNIRHEELMHGPSWASELPTRVVTMYEARIQRPDAADRESRFPQFDWDVESKKEEGSEKSAFAEREDVRYCIALPVHGEDLRTTVLCLNFRQKPSAQMLSDEALGTAVNELRGAIQQVWGAHGTVGTMEVGQSNRGAVLDLLSLAFHDGPRACLTPRLREGLETVGSDLWPNQDAICKAYGLEQRVRCLEDTSEPLKFQDVDHPERDVDDMVAGSARNGETFYVTNLGERGVRTRFDPWNKIPGSLVQKLVVPVVCEAFLDAPVRFEAAESRQESPGHRVLQNRASSRDFVDCWGALSVESREMIFAPAKRSELNNVAHLLACALYLRAKAENAPPKRGQFFKDILRAVDDTVQILGEGPGPESVHAEERPLDELCKAVVEKKLLPSVERCDVYRYDRVSGGFIREGAFLAQDWLGGLSKIFLDGKKVKYLAPRKGGNSERLLGITDEYHVISDAPSHPRVSPVTKLIGTRSLVGCPCKIGCSFRAEAVLWLGSRAPLPRDYLERDNMEMFYRLRVLAHVAALFCVLLRWWPSGSTARPSRHEAGPAGRA